uniref:Outer membrane protein/protective antigen OMA87-like protein n=1 Tax=Solibacter usitatus (strain Ellin6076) TaxID=234267 RepID=Q026E2_SOLUE
MQQMSVLGTLLLASIAAAQPLTVAGVRVAGNERLPAAAILRATGVRPGQAATLETLDAAVSRLFETGLFTSLNYRYEQIPGSDPAAYIVTFQLLEDRADTDVRIEIAAIDEASIWKDLAAADPLVTRRMPHNDRAGDFYCRAVERVLERAGRHEKIVVSSSVDLATRRMETTLVPANPPKVTDVRFQGIHALSSAALRDAVGRIVIDNRYSEREFRQVLDLNVRPMYEERGYLKVEFPSIRLTPAAGDLSIDVQVIEGTPWTLGTASLIGDHLPEEAMRKASALWEVHTANWKLILEAITRMEKVLRREGYLGVTSKPVRLFRDDGRTVDLRIEVTKGKQFVLGALSIAGLSDRDRMRAEKLFRIKPGEPLDQPYLEDYVKQCLDFLGNSVKGFDSKLSLRGDTNLVDLTLTFK